MQLNSVVGGYKVIELIGEGSTATVFRGMDVLLEREVALKLFRPELAQNPQLVKRFRAEAVALARLNHPHIVTLHQLVCDIEHCFMVLEFVRGETLDSLVRRCGPTPWQTALPLICQALDGLEHAHILKVIHGDIKPANLILTESGGIKLMDFRIDQMLESSAAVHSRYTPDMLKYMAPEQIKGLPVDTRVDIYTIGMVLYELLTAHAWSDGDGHDQPIRAHRDKAPKSPRTLVATIPARLEAAVLRALEPSPKDRFQSAAEFRDELEALLKDASADQELEDGEESGAHRAQRLSGLTADSFTSQTIGEPLSAAAGPGADESAAAKVQPAMLAGRGAYSAMLHAINAKYPWIRKRRVAILTLLLLPVFFHAFYLMFSTLSPSGKEAKTPSISVVESSPAVQPQNNVFHAAIASRAVNEALKSPVSFDVLPRKPEMTPEKVEPLEKPLAGEGVTDQSIESMVPKITQAINPEDASDAGNTAETTKDKGKAKSASPRRSHPPNKLDGGWTIVSH